eukprot:TRINITY_DN23227_c0_g1_i1.p1 TRINITY_DN23227_c0_g1~~TRINITY_DN23227_c0_g1_i1.p1  ORF type:complete len:130 (+),score=45.14 TRINITY_DN23227_c0_g1_i1:92-481(+)
MKDPTTITPEEDEEQLIMRRLRNSVDELKRGTGGWTSGCRGKSKAEDSKEQREGIELLEEKVSTRGEPSHFQAEPPAEEGTQCRKKQKAGDGRLVYKGCKLNNRFLNNYRPTIGQFVTTYGLCYATRLA